MAEETETTSEMLSRIHEQVNDHVEKLRSVKATECGLDARSGVFYVDDQYVIVEKARERNMKYYGGFEYVDEEHRQEAGDYVFYSCGDERVAECLDELSNNEDSVKQA